MGVVGLHALRGDVKCISRLYAEIPAWRGVVVGRFADELHTAARIGLIELDRTGGERGIAERRLWGAPVRVPELHPPSIGLGGFAPPSPPRARAPDGPLLYHQP